MRSSSAPVFPISLERKTIRFFFFAREIIIASNCCAAPFDRDESVFSCAFLLYYTIIQMYHYEDYIDTWTERVRSHSYDEHVRGGLEET